MKTSWRVKPVAALTESFYAYSTGGSCSSLFVWSSLTTIANTCDVCWLAHSTLPLPLWRWELVAICRTPRSW